jgi:hypothetical protein
VIVGVVALALLGGGAWLWWQSSLPAAGPPQPPPAEVATPEPAPPAVPPASEPAIRHPLAGVDEAPVPAVPPDISSALADLFGRKTALSMFQPQDFPRRFVATVDNLGRSHAPAALWPVNPAAGRLVVENRDGAVAISADNGLRYTPYVLLLENVDMRQAFALYRRLYPSLQQAYEDIGYPKRYFNDRLVEVIDLLLATPAVDGPLKVHLPTINGPLQPERPWVLYEFDDPALQSLAAGQKVLLRMGPVNERRMKTRLAEIRRLLTASAAPR